ncbi:MAG: acetyl-CoA carboxylase biotin carboxylase subunit [Gammaproteobacteria bacterium]|nr:acetyl-CoA carboxylase biotin carboxylase subunit [Gammaproteobacteria bacterium]
MFKKILIANRGEIALRVLRACKKLHIKTVAVYSAADRDLMHVHLADEAVCIGPAAPSESYLSIPAIISAAEITNANAIHPGYGFLAENADFAEQVENSGFVFIGPSPKTIRIMGNKITAINTMKRAQVPCLPSFSNIRQDQPEKTLAAAEKIGYPIMVKAAGGGGGRGMRIVHHRDELINSIAMTSTEADAAFGNDEVYMEKFLDHPRHIEVQVLADGKNAIYLGERDCSTQRRHQKILEEAPAIGITAAQRKKIGEICVQACCDLGYIGAGTFEFLYQDDSFYFIEMNTRIQVEHPITEMITGIDIISEQIRTATGLPLSIKQSDITLTGHAIECRINAESPTTFIPCPGKIEHFHAPGGIGVRVDSHLYSSYYVPPFYDSMIAKVIVHSDDRDSAIASMNHALDELIVDGINTNIDTHKQILRNKAFIAGGTNIHFLESMLKK